MKRPVMGRLLSRSIGAGALFLLLIAVLVSGRSAHSAEEDCLGCHEDYKKGKVVHAALDMGCTTCHSALDASDVPHKSKNKIAKGLTSELPDLCYQCHNKSKFAQANVHAAVGMGCGSCHNPHSSKNTKLLIAMEPALCYNCHDKADFNRKNVHTAVGMGCSTCHTPHASETAPLLKKQPMALCLECHADVSKRPHAIVGFTTVGHPLGGPTKPGSKDDDPARPGKRFYCGSCHDPHSSDYGRLFRYKAATSFDLCGYCHKM